MTLQPTLSLPDSTSRNHLCQPTLNFSRFFLAAKVFQSKKGRKTSRWKISQSLKFASKVLLGELARSRYPKIFLAGLRILWGLSEMEVSNSIQMHSIRMFRRDSDRDSTNPRGTFHNLYHTKGQYWCNQPLDWWLNRVPCTWWLNWWVSLMYYRDLWFHKW